MIIAEETLFNSTWIDSGVSISIQDLIYPVVKIPLFSDFLFQSGFPNKPCVYIIFNIEDESFYIGSTIYSKKRLISHRNLLVQKKHTSKRLQTCYNKTGQVMFMISLIWTVDLEQTRNLEQYFLDKYIGSAKCCNSSIDSRCRSGIPNSEETRKKISSSLKGRKLSQLHRSRMSLSHLGKKFSEQHKQKIRQNQLNRKPSEASRLKMSLSHQGRPLSEDNKLNISKALKGRQVTLEHRQKISQALKNVKKSEQHILKMKNARIGFKHSQEAIEKIRANSKSRWNPGLQAKAASARMKPVIVNSVRYNSVKQAAESLGLTPQRVIKRIKSKTKKFSDYNYI